MKSFVPHDDWNLCWELILQLSVQTAGHYKKGNNIFNFCYMLSYSIFSHSVVLPAIKTIYLSFNHCFLLKSMLVLFTYMSDIYPPITQVYVKKQISLKLYWREKIFWHLFLLEFTQIYLCSSVQSAKFAIANSCKIVILRGMNRRTTTSYQTWAHKNRDRKQRFKYLILACNFVIWKALWNL